MHGYGPLFAPMACLAALVGVVVLLTLSFVPVADQASVLGGLAIGGCLAVLISRALGR